MSQRLLEILVLVFLVLLPTWSGEQTAPQYAESAAGPSSSNEITAARLSDDRAKTNDAESGLCDSQWEPDLAGPRGEIADVVLSASADWTPGNQARYEDLLRQLRLEADSNSVAIVEAIDSLDVRRRWGYEGRVLVYALGHVGTSSALPTLLSMLSETVSSEEFGHFSLRHEASMTKSIAAYAIEAVVSREHAPELVDMAIAALLAVLRDRSSSPHLAATAIEILSRRDPGGEASGWQAQVATEFVHLMQVKRYPPGNPN